jgi:hypothetical protein
MGVHKNSLNFKKRCFVFKGQVKTKKGWFLGRNGCIEMRKTSSKTLKLDSEFLCNYGGNLLIDKGI